MHHIVGGTLVLVLGMMVGAEDKHSTAPEQQYKALLKKYNDAFRHIDRGFVGPNRASV